MWDWFCARAQVHRQCVRTRHPHTSARGLAVRRSRKCACQPRRHNAPTITASAGRRRHRLFKPLPSYWYSTPIILFNYIRLGTIVFSDYFEQVIFWKRNNEQSQIIMGKNVSISKTWLRFSRTTKNILKGTLNRLWFYFALTLSKETPI